MKKAMFTMLPIAAIALMLTAPQTVAGAQDSGSTTYKAKLTATTPNAPAGAASGDFTLTLNGDQATIVENVSGLADTLPTDTATLDALGIPQAFAGKPFPHVQHIHINGQHACPTPAADTNGDGVISTVEGQPAYGKIGATLSVSGDTSPAAATDVTIAPSGGGFTYSRTITLDPTTLAAVQGNKAVIVVHGLNPANAPAASLTTPNSLGVTLPGADKELAMIGTAPTLCGPLQLQEMATTPATTPPTTQPSTKPAEQITVKPIGGVQTGGGSTSGLQNDALILLGGSFVAAAAMVLIISNRSKTEANS
ncbi:MAG: hypothetical protein ABIP03_01700 [Aquihabitans sp.]